MKEFVSFVTVKELAKRLKITRHSVWHLVHQGKITAPMKINARLCAWPAAAAAEIERATISARQEREQTKAVDARKTEERQNRAMFAAHALSGLLASGIYEREITKWKRSKDTEDMSRHDFKYIFESLLRSLCLDYSDLMMETLRIKEKCEELKIEHDYAHGLQP
jgi:predicted DNA-binding transcriptional regulator AlpA